MESTPQEHSSLPRPFYDHGWPRRLRPAAQALWHWHVHLIEADAPRLDGDDLTAYFEAEREKAAAGNPVRVVPASVWQDAYRACEEHELPRGLLTKQILGARRFQEPIRFATYAELDAFLHQWAIPHGRLLAHLADTAYSWQLRRVDELTRGLFFVGRLVQLPEEVGKDWIFIPREEREQAGVTLDDLQAGNVTERVRRLLWKQTVRARDALAHARPLSKELERPYKNAFKRVWLGGLELLTLIERRDYELWSEPIQLSLFRRLQVRFQARLGKIAFRK